MNQTLTEGEYYQAQGLEKDPFPIDAVDDIYFVTPEIKHRLELINHLLEFSNQLIVVTAPPGAGKSALCHYLAANMDTNWSVSQVVAKADMGPMDLALEVVSEPLLDRFGREHRSGKGLSNYLESCHRDQTIPALFIDDAHLLSVDTLEYITKLIDLRHEETRLRILLFAEEAIIKRLDDPMIKAGSAGILHTLSLQPLNLEQTSAYLQYRFNACGIGAESPFTNKDFRQIYKVSGGIPGKINHLARQVLQDPALFRDSSNEKFTRKTFPLVVTVVAVLIIAAYVISEQKQNANETREISLPLPAQETETQEPGQGQAQLEEAAEPGAPEAEVDTAVSEAPITEEATTEEAVPEELPTEEAVAEQQALPQELLTTLEGEAEPVGVDKLIPGIDLEPKTEAEAQVTEKPIETKPASVAKTSPKETEKTAGRDVQIIAGVKGADWLRQQPPGSYVLQLIGAYEPAALLTLLQGQSLDQGRLAAFITTNQGKKWYVLVYGLYPNRESALAAIPSLPPTIRAQRPWGRSIASIHQELESRP